MKYFSVLKKICKNVVIRKYKATKDIFHMNFIGHRKCKYQKLFHDRIVNISQSHKVNIHQLSLRPLLLILLVHVAFFNLQYGLVKFSKLAFEGVEPGPGFYNR